jgi:DNA-binding transcriptional regulator GbsR (MarR family)
VSISQRQEQSSDPSAAELIRRRFAQAWGQMGAAWGIAPSTAAVQGYLLVHGGPVTDSELQEALGLRRSGRRGPAGRAWLALDDNWEWFRRVVEGRKEREGDPVIAILEECMVEANALPDGEEQHDLRVRLDRLLDFVGQFDHALSAVMRARVGTLRKLFRVLAEQDARALDRLLAALADIPDDELDKALRSISRMSPTSLRHLLQLAGRKSIVRLLGR